jgi:hypothetical protein
MKGYQLFFIFLRLMVISQVVLIVFKKQTRSSDTYIILDAISRAAVGLFLYLFFLLHPLPDLEYGDVLILQFAGILLLVDIDYKSVLGVIRKRYPNFLKSIYGS